MFFWVKSFHFSGRGFKIFLDTLDFQYLYFCNQRPNYLHITGAPRRASLRTGQQGEEAEPRRRGGARPGLRRLRRPRPALGRHRGQRRRRARHPDPAPRPRQPGPGGRLMGLVTLSSEHAIMVTPSDCLQVK